MPAPAYEILDQGPGCYIIASVSPTGERLEPPCVFRAPRSWYEERAHNDWIQPISEGEYERRRSGQEAESADDELEFTAEVVDADETADAEPEPEGDDGAPDEGNTVPVEPSGNAPASVAESHLADIEDDVRPELPDEEPDEDAPDLERLLWAYYEGDYNGRRGVIADLSDRPATGGGGVIELKLLREIYDRELAAAEE